MHVIFQRTINTLFNDPLVGVIGVDGLRFLAVFGMLCWFLALKMTVLQFPLFLNGFQISLQNMTQGDKLSQN